ncbi:MAG: RidA family protein [Actinobacteria bacterium]|nr:RidA family protein [Actinomycetota bacterium]MDI6830132.1 RidA family protein [Actinomycetota bacterium]
MADGFQVVEGEGIPVPKGPYSPAVVWERLVFVSGLLAVNPDGREVAGDVREEALVVLRNLKRLLEEAGSGLDRVLAVNVYLADIEDLFAFNEVYEEFFRPPYPSRSAVGVSLLGGFRLELSAVAYRE